MTRFPCDESGRERGHAVFRPRFLFRPVAAAVRIAPRRKDEKSRATPKDGPAHSSPDGSGGPLSLTRAFEKGAGGGIANARTTIRSRPARRAQPGPRSEHPRRSPSLRSR